MVVFVSCSGESPPPPRRFLEYLPWIEGVRVHPWAKQKRLSSVYWQIALWGMLLAVEHMFLKPDQRNTQKEICDSTGRSRETNGATFLFGSRRSKVWTSFLTPEKMKKPSILKLHASVLERLLALAKLMPYDPILRNRGGHAWVTTRPRQGHDQATSLEQYPAHFCARIRQIYVVVLTARTLPTCTGCCVGSARK